MANPIIPIGCNNPLCKGDKPYYLKVKILRKSKSRFSIKAKRPT